MTIAVLLALALALALSVALLRGRLPLELLALGLVIAAVLAGWLSPSEALAGFGSPATISVVAMFVISAAVMRSGALAPIERWLGSCAGFGLAGQLLLLAAVVGPLSAVLSNTAVVAMFIPLVERWCRRQGMAPARMLMPLSFLTVLAGVGTLLGTSTNLVASSLAAQLGYGSFSLLQFTPMALVTYAAGVLVLVLVAPRVLPNPAVLPLAEELECDYGIGDYLSELRVEPASPLVGCSLDASLLQHSFDLRVLALIRQQAWLLPPLGDRLLLTGDVLVVKARRDSLLALQQQEGLALLPAASVHLRAGPGRLDRQAPPQPPARSAPEPPPADADAAVLQAPQQSVVASGPSVAGDHQADPLSNPPAAAAVLPLDLAVVEAVVPAGSPLIGQSLRELRFAQRTNAAVLAIRRGEQLLLDRLGQVSLQLGDALLLQAPDPSLRALEVSGDLLLADRAEAPSDRRDRLPWTIALTVAVLLLTLWRSEALAIWALLAVVGMVAGRVLSPQEVYASVRWDVVVLLGALLPLATVLRGSELDRVLVDALTTVACSWPPYAVLISLYLATALATELLSNQAAVTLMLPLALAIGRELGVTPLAVMGVVTFAASHSFLTPVGYQTNTMVFALGNYSFLDFLKLGLPLTLVLCLLTPALALAL
jgi:di/tricarboxylate transporter